MGEEQHWSKCINCTFNNTTFFPKQNPQTIKYKCPINANTNELHFMDQLELQQASVHSLQYQASPQGYSPQA